jgi:hypothetical protein
LDEHLEPKDLGPKDICVYKYIFIHICT